MRRPVGVRVIAVPLSGFPILLTYVFGMEMYKAWPEWSFMGLAPFVVVGITIFLSASLAVGLWNYEEGARQVAFSLLGCFVFPIGIAFFWDWALRGEMSQGAGLFFLTVLLPFLYLMRPKVKEACNQLTILHLRDSD